MNIAVAYSTVDLAVAADYVSNWRLELVRLSQAFAGLRAANVKTYDRRNTSHTLAFTVTRAPVASAKLALAFLGTHQRDLDAITGVADIVVTLTPATASTITLKNATLTRAAGRVVGCTTIFDYELTAGLLVIA
jgi:hypothetical protein